MDNIGTLTLRGETGLDAFFINSGCTGNANLNIVSEYNDNNNGCYVDVNSGSFRCKDITALYVSTSSGATLEADNISFINSAHASNSGTLIIHNSLNLNRGYMVNNGTIRIPSLDGTVLTEFSNRGTVIADNAHITSDQYYDQRSSGSDYIISNSIEFSNLRSYLMGTVVAENENVWIKSDGSGSFNLRIGDGTMMRITGAVDTTAGTLLNPDQELIVGSSSPSVSSNVFDANEKKYDLNNIRKLTLVTSGGSGNMVIKSGCTGRSSLDIDQKSGSDARINFTSGADFTCHDLTVGAITIGSSPTEPATLSVNNLNINYGGASGLSTAYNWRVTCWRNAWINEMYIC